MHSGRLRLSIVALLVGVLAFASPATAFAQDATSSTTGDNGTVNPDNIVVAENDKDDSSIFDFGFKIFGIFDDTVDSGNAAVAVSSCDSCRTVAIAISIVLVLGEPTAVVPENLALAVNLDCTLCETMALAYQLVLSPGEDIQIRGTDLARIRRLINEIRSLGASDLPLAEIDAQVSALVDEMFGIVREALAPDTDDTDNEDDGDAEPSPSPSPSPTTSATPAPTPTEPSPTSTSEPTVEPSPSPNESGDPSPQPTPTG